MSKKRLFLIDGNSFCYRAYYAVRPLSNSKGQPTNAVFGFVTMVHKLVKDHKPDMLAVAFDLKGPTFRHKKYDEYKIHRKPMPDDLVSQIPYIKRVVRAHNIPIYELEGYEADDVLATLAKKAEERDIETMIVTGDKDALQMVNSHIKVMNTHKDDLVYDARKVEEVWGVAPEHITDLMSLMGDASDNIPGVPGIGEKTAVELMKEFGSLDNLLKNVDKVKGEARKKAIKDNEKLAVMSKELAVLDANVPVKIDFDEMKVSEPDQQELFELFRELEFKSLLKDVMPKESFKAHYELIDDEKKLDKLIEKLEGLDEFAFDTETTSTEPVSARLVGMSFCWEAGKAYYVPFCVSNQVRYVRLRPCLTWLDNVEDVLTRLKPVFENSKIKKIGQNIKYDYMVLANYGIKMAGIGFDTMVASYVLNPSKLNHNLEDISLEYLSHRLTTPITDLLGKGKKAITMDRVEVDKVCAYCCEDSDVTLRLKEKLAVEVSKKELDELFYKVEIPLIEVLATMETSGVSIDTDYLAELSAGMDGKLAKLTKKVYEIAGEEFNINSPKQLGVILFEKLKLPVIKKTKTGFSTDEEVLRKLAPKHGLPEKLLEFRELSKLKSTYVDALPALIDAKTGKVHTSFNQTVTATGRLSSSGPNLQNIPIKTEEGRKIRRAFIPTGSGNVLISADYSQIELRILAHLSEDKALIAAFRDGLDIHSYTASLVFGVKEKDVTSEMRGMAKTVNFGIVYGMSPYGLSQSLNIEVDKAKEFIDSYFERYPGVKVYMEGLITGARENGFVTTILGRRRCIPEINSPDIRMKQFAERTAINTPIQGSAADVIKVAMLEIHEKLAKSGLGTKMILQVHDELVFDAPKDEVKEAVRIVRHGMENVLKLKVPIEAHIESGKNWLEMESVED